MRLRLSLPVADPQAIAKSADAAPIDAALLATRRPAPLAADAEAEGTLILVADDHSTNRMLLRGQLNLLGYACETAEGGREAFDLWASGRFALLITDCHMPEMDGYALARAIREREAGTNGRRISIIACTANALEGEAQACLAAGMDGYLAKPVELRALLAALDRWLPLREAPQQRSAGRRDIAGRPGAKADAARLDRTKLAELTGGDERLEREILADFWSAMDDDTAQLAAAVESGDCDATARVSHRIKGASRMVGAIALSTICEKIEAAGRSADQATILAQHAPLEREMKKLRRLLA
jgi:CheY-like chemotaxis protein/HPt (histidine-containing phosphotransfer) domain-containing protein